MDEWIINVSLFILKTINLIIFQAARKRGKFNCITEG